MQARPSSYNPVSCTICIVPFLFYRVHLVQLNFRFYVQFARCHSYSTVVCISYSKTEMMLYSFTVHLVNLICFTVPFVQLKSCFTVQYVQFSFRFLQFVQFHFWFCCTLYISRFTVRFILLSTTIQEFHCTAEKQTNHSP